MLEVPEYGCINVHASLLPELRGGAPIHYAICEGKQESGVTIMYMEEKLDTGDILTQEAVPIEPDDHVGSLHDKLSRTGADLLADTLPQLFDGKLTPIPQNQDKATYAMNIKREQERIDWNLSVQEVYNHIRGLYPWPVAFTSYKGKVMKIWWGEPTARTFSGKPGEIAEKEEDAFIVICGDKQGIRITNIQPAGKKRMTVKDYLRGSADRIETGVILGDSQYE